MGDLSGKCIICGHDKSELLIKKDSLQINKCMHCGLGFINPFPSDRVIQYFYEREYFNDKYDAGLSPDSPQFGKRLRGENHRIRFIKSIKPAGRLLDMGCGLGYFLAACRNAGYDVMGMDISDWAVQYAAEMLKLPVVIGSLGNASFPPAYFDVITMWHFLEHTRRPDEIILMASQWLKKDGIIVIDVPNYEGTDAVKQWEEWDGWSLPYHLYHFTPRALSMLLRKNGFAVIRSKTYHSRTVKENLKKIPLISSVSRLIAKMYSGASIAVIAKMTD